MDVFEVLSDLHHGVFGDVYLCERKHNKLKVVVKKITDNNRLKLAKNEASILKLLNHPNVIQYFDSFIKNNESYIVMDYAINGNLHDYIARHRPNFFSRKFILSIFCQILMGLDHIHKRKIIHHDIKCENIFLSGVHNFIVKIGDFGASKRMNDIHVSENSVTLGTTNYVAPEISGGQIYDTKVDMWALGCVLYELCAMERLFDGSMDTIISIIKSGKRKSINSKRYGPHVQNIINQLIEITPKLRPTACDLLAHGIIFPIYYKFIISLGGMLKI